MFKFSQRRFTANPHSRQEIQQSYLENEDDKNPNLPTGSSFVAKERDFSGRDWFVKSRMRFKPQQVNSSLLNVSTHSDVSNQALLEHVGERQTLRAEKAFEAEDLRILLDDNLKETSHLSFLELPEEAASRDKQQLLHQLEQAASDIARAFCSRRFPLVVSVDHFKYLQSLGFKDFVTVAELTATQNYSREEITSRFANEGGGAISAVNFLLENGDINARNIGFSGHAVAIDLGVCFSQLSYRISYTQRKDFNLSEERVWDIIDDADLLAKTAGLKDFASIAYDVKLKDSFHVSDDVLFALPLSSCDPYQESVSDGLNAKTSSRVGYCPYNDWSTCFDLYQHESNVQKFMHANPIFKRDQYLQFLIAIIIFETGFIHAVLNHKSYDQLLKQQILNSVIQKITKVKKVLLDPNNRTCRELRSLVTPELLYQTLEEHIHFYNQQTPSQEPRLNLQDCREKAGDLVAALEKPLNAEDVVVPRGPQLEISIKALQHTIYMLCRYLKIYSDVNTIKDRELLLRLKYVLQRAVLFNRNFLNKEDKKIFKDRLDCLFVAKNPYVNFSYLNWLEEILENYHAVEIAYCDFFDAVKKHINSNEYKLKKYFIEFNRCILEWVKVNVTNQDFIEKLTGITPLVLFIQNNCESINDIKIINRLIHVFAVMPNCESAVDSLVQDIIFETFVRTPLDMIRDELVAELTSNTFMELGILLRECPTLACFSGYQTILIFMAEVVFVNDSNGFKAIKDRFAIIKNETQKEIIDLLFRVVSNEIYVKRFLSQNEFIRLHDFIKKTNAENPAQFAVLLNQEAIEFLTEVFLAMDPDIDDSWDESILLAALHWYEQTESAMLEKDVEQFFDAIEELTKSRVELQSLDDAAGVSRTLSMEFMQSMLFELKYQRELEEIKQFCEDDRHKQRSSLAEDLVKLNQRVIHFLDDNNLLAAEQALDCCERVVKSFSKKNEDEWSAGFPTIAAPFNATNYSALAIDEESCILLASITQHLQNPDQGIVAKNHRQMLFSGENTSLTRADGAVSVSGGLRMNHQRAF